jgi:hypothetical protein
MTEKETFEDAASMKQASKFWTSSLQNKITILSSIKFRGLFLISECRRASFFADSLSAVLQIVQENILEITIDGIFIVYQQFLEEIGQKNADINFLIVLG